MTGWNLLDWVITLYLWGLAFWVTFSYHEAKGTSEGLKVIYSILSALFALPVLLWWTGRLLVFRFAGR